MPYNPKRTVFIVYDQRLNAKDEPNKVNYYQLFNPQRSNEGALTNKELASEIKNPCREVHVILYKKNEGMDIYKCLSNTLKKIDAQTKQFTLNTAEFFLLSDCDNAADWLNSLPNGNTSKYIETLPETDAIENLISKLIQSYYYSINSANLAEMSEQETGNYLLNRYRHEYREMYSKVYRAGSALFHGKTHSSGLSLENLISLVVTKKASRRQLEVMKTIGWLNENYEISEFAPEKIKNIATRGVVEYLRDENDNEVSLASK